jgi:hypothetical protein
LSVLAIFSPRSVSNWYALFPVVILIMYGPSQFGASLPSLAFRCPMSARRSTKSHTAKSLGITLLLYRLSDTFLITDSASDLKFLVS